MTTVFKKNARKSSSGRYGQPRSETAAWSQAEIDRCMLMHDDDYSPEDIAVALRRSRTSVEAKIRCSLERRRREEGIIGRTSRISQSQEDERQRRKAGNDARDVTATFFGDPPRGFSALDKRESPI
jgi:hypothetical protein